MIDFPRDVLFVIYEAVERDVIGDIDRAYQDAITQTFRSRTPRPDCDELERVISLAIGASALEEG